MKIVIIGTGYVGLVTGVCFAEVGVETVCIDIDKNKIENLKKGISPIYEPGLDELITKNLERGRLSFDTDISKVLDGAEMAFIAVGTPPDEDGSADLKYVLEVAHNIGKYMNDYLVVVTKSTVPVGTALKVKEAIQFELNKRNLNIDFDVASNPEFLKEGDAINDFMKPDRIVIGVESDRAQEIFQRLYKPFTLNGHPIIFMDIPSAEMTKYAANAMLATRISFMNDIANLCEILGADVNMVRLGIGSDPRIGSKFLYPGIGYGGSCFPKDVKALIKAGEENNYPLRLLQAVENINEAQKSILVDKLLKFYNGDISGKKIALWGLSFKPNTDDMREAPSLVIIDKLLKNNAQVSAYDPVSMEETKRRIGDVINYASDMYEAVKDADALILVTEWSEFRLPDWFLIRQLMKKPLVLDGRNIYDASEMKKMGFYYYCIGVKTH
ncbi:MAG TPA: UDP-glucose/GDP-mannose dehydrogenase family protein [Bacteroidales bacterium]|jgi:UDPglucose 6-dehydrogenase|nr:UDP-glucose/GDP-mannose dehydrogenase family protein [Bacteroidales bacterium]HOB26804.1 UDP-glucose/GDP-mannose dehydrogenase family protein [Bacteroidales bacterium]HOK22058.1 UDP-glucose/GDP-mannose dehydrogenase family protein [Bacteroidales bacterium]HOL74606.1 UDP-glucose/GDP-mannose dehydrogenase family protein [Bacteroidales bacterium]HPU46826.1 UDP-glucose/GDP-mannose dehydrogenase family protein [Bacteroidales bacterium]